MHECSLEFQISEMLQCEKNNNCFSRLFAAFSYYCVDKLKNHYPLSDTHTNCEIRKSESQVTYITLAKLA